MSFTNYLKQIGIDIVLGIVGLIGILGAIGSLMEGAMIMALVFFVVGALCLLYMRYRAQWKGVSY